MYILYNTYRYILYLVKQYLSGHYVQLKHEKRKNSRNIKISMSKASILLTANNADCPQFLNRLAEIKELLLHLPLEKYEHFVKDEDSRILAKKMREFVFQPIA
mgnify:CR=1 FL=1